MAYGVSDGHVVMASRDPQRCCEAVRSAILATAWLLVFDYVHFCINLLIVVYLISDNYMPVMMTCARDDDSPSND